MLKRSIERLSPRYAWARTLDFHDGTVNHQTMPEPFVEIDFEAWWRHCYNGHECLIEETFDQLFLDGANTMGMSNPERGFISGPLWGIYFRLYPSGVYATAHEYRWASTPPIALPHRDRALWIPMRYQQPSPRLQRRDDAPFTGTGYINRFFRIGCEHTRQNGKTIGNCLHEYTCLECGWVYQVDSSG